MLWLTICNVYDFHSSLILLNNLCIFSEYLDLVKSYNLLLTMSESTATEAADKNVEIWKVKKLIKSLEAARGNGTSMISLIIPPGQTLKSSQVFIIQRVILTPNKLVLALAFFILSPGNSWFLTKRNFKYFLSAFFLMHWVGYRAWGIISGPCN